MMRLAAVLCGAALACSAAQPVETPVETLAGIEQRVSQSDLAGARALLETALRRYPGDGRLHNLQGILAAQSNDYAAAESAFRKAVRCAPQLAGAWLNLGRLYQTHVAADPRAAEKGTDVYRHILASQPDLPEANYQLALLLQWRGAFRESMTHLDRLPPEDRERTGVLALRCTGQAGLGDTQAAQVTAGQILERPGLEEADVLAILPILEKTGAAEVTRALLDGLAERNLASRETLARLAALHEKAADFARARKAYEAVAQASPDLTKPLMDLARVAWRQKDYEGVLGYLGHARDLEPKNAGVHFLFGLAANELHLAAEAKQSLQKAVDLAPEDPYYNYALGVLALQWSDKQPAIPYLKKYTAAKPDDPRGRLALATAYFLLFDFDAAKAEALRIANDPAMKPAAQYLLGCIARENGELDQAVTHLQTTLQLAPGMTEAHAELAAVFIRKEDYRAAERETKLALARDPDSFAANQALMQIYRNTQDPRAGAQAERLKTLVEDRNRQMQLMLRSIEVRPY